MADHWFVPLAGDASVRVFAFPHAGAGPAQLAGLAGELAPGVAVWAANLPGRQARAGERPRTDIEELGAELADAVVGLMAEQPGRDYGLFGYCGGALIAFAVARYLRASRAPQPAALIVANFHAPDVVEPARLARLPSDMLWPALVRHGGVAPEIAGDQRLRALTEPAVRADFAMIENYRYRADLPLPYPITVCFGSRDTVSRGALLGWRRQTAMPLTLRDIPASRWLLDEACRELADVIGGSLPSEVRG